MHSKTRLGLTVLAMLIGLSVLALYTTLVQDVLFKNVSFCSASTIELTFKVLALGTAGLVTGFLTSVLISGLWAGHYGGVKFPLSPA